MIVLLEGLFEIEFVDGFSGCIFIFIFYGD